MEPESVSRLYSHRVVDGPGWGQTGLGTALGVLVLAGLLSVPDGGGAQEGGLPPTTHMTCGECPSGFATTGVTTDEMACKEGDHTVVQCVPVGSLKLLAVCGSCPEGYTTIGSSNVPARCGTLAGGLLSQCQVSDLGGGMPDPNQGGVFCPPNCAGQMPTPGQGALPPPPKYVPAPETK